MTGAGRDKTDFVIAGFCCCKGEFAGALALLIDYFVEVVEYFFDGDGELEVGGLEVGV